MPVYFRFLFLSTLLLNARSIFAQLPDFCATDIKVEASLRRFPEMRKNFYQVKKENERKDALDYAGGYAAAKGAVTSYIIPTVFHIIHENGQENVSDAQVLDAMEVLNNDFRKANSDTNLIVPAFQGVAADCQIQFRLAKLDPNGNCTNGIDRIYSSQTNIGDDGSKLNPWPHENYYNIWVVKNISPGGIAGYAYYPGTAPQDAEGVIILHNYLGSIGTSSTFSSRVLTHETGHYLNLPHVWGSTNSPGVACGDDGVNDTPITKGWTSCNLAASICSPGIIENVQNYMEYSYCTKMFTWGQKAWMTAALNSPDGSRNTLWTAGNLILTGIDNSSLCTADFSASPNPGALCAGETITFKDHSYNGKPNFWNWSFPGGTLVAPSTINDSMPSVQYLAAGTYSVSLSVSNGGGSANTTKTAYVSVNPATAQSSSSSFIDDFEIHTVPGDWAVHDLDGFGTTWQKTTVAQVSGNYSVFIDNSNSNFGDADELISPSINISAIASPYFTFKYAFTAKTGTASKLLVFVSADCGKSWYQRKGISGTALLTAPSTFGNFIPQANEWKEEIVSISNVISKNNVLIKFKFINEDGNNLYLDDIAILSNLGEEEKLENLAEYSIAPNPIDASSQLSLSLRQKSKVKIELYSLTGEKVKEIYTGDINQGSHQIEINKSDELSAGLYNLALFINDFRFIKKLIVK